jgi:hypothetical protein
MIRRSASMGTSSSQWSNPAISTVCGHSTGPRSKAALTVDAAGLGTRCGRMRTSGICVGGGLGMQASYRTVHEKRTERISPVTTQIVQVLCAVFVFTLSLVVVEHMSSLLERQWSRIVMALATLGLILVTAWLISHTQWLLFGVVVAYIAQALLAQTFKNPPARTFSDYFSREPLKALSSTNLSRVDMSRMLVRLGRTAEQQGSECASRITTSLHVERHGALWHYSLSDVYQLKLQHRIVHDVSIRMQGPKHRNATGETEFLAQVRPTDFGDKWAIYYTLNVSPEEWHEARQAVSARLLIGQSGSLSAKRLVEVQRSEDPDSGSLLFRGKIEMDEKWDTLTVSVSSVPHLGDTLQFYAWMLATDHWEFSATLSPDLAVERRWSLTAITGGIMPVQVVAGPSARLRIEARDMIVLPDDAVVARLMPL